MGPMSDPISSAALRGAVDLSRLAAPAPTSGGASRAAASPSGARLITDADVAGLVNESMNIPVLLVLWASSVPASRDHVADVVQAAAAYEGRFVIAEADIEASPALGQAFQVRAVPLVAAILQGRPAPLYEGAQPAETLSQLLGEMVKVAVANGMTGRAAPAAAQPDVPGEEPEPELPPHLAAAYEALEAGDVATAQQVLTDAQAKNPADEEVRLLLAQVNLMMRTRDLDTAQVRAAAAEAPDDVAAQARAADLDLLGGHVEDAFARLVDLVKRTRGAERDQAREHLVGLFDIVGQDDERVRRARQALMRALF